MNDAEQAAPSIAAVGMAGRFPKAADLDAFWRNIEQGLECISFFSDEEVRQAGIDPIIAESPNFVKARAILDDADCFDAPFFGFTPREAELSDPQQRLFLECAWQALENAGCDPARYAGLIGVYAGADVNAYAAGHLFLGSGGLQGIIGNDKDYLATRTAFKLNLRGPAVSVQTACSTSLVAVQLACQALLNYQCDAALAGGVGIAFPQKAGYWYEEGSILSPDGHCRAFDAKAQGTVGGDGVGLVVLKRLEDALAEGDFIHAVIKGAAINNDGAIKLGFTAPSVAGQTEVIAMAQAAADVDPDTVGYIEAHGTGTELGDPIEITALTEVFRATTDKKQFCAIGSLKTNVGHMNSAAGIGGLLKTILALKHKTLPPSLHFEAPNPRIDFADSPFYVNTRAQPWPAGATPRRAGVSSFGIGGTNAHVVLEEAPEQPPSGPSRSHQLLVVSAKTGAALEAATARLADHLDTHPELDLADTAYTLLNSRQLFKHRRLWVCKDRIDALGALREPSRAASIVRDTGAAGVAFLFPGQGAQYVDMGKGLYAAEPVLREIVDDCCERLRRLLGLDLRDVLFPNAGDANAASEHLRRTAYTQPALFVIEYALAKLWMSWGVQPEAMLGHSIGEYVAACLAGVFSLDDALGLVAGRARLMQQLPAGSMLAVALDEEQARAYPQAAVAAVNAPGSCVLSGATDAIAAIEGQLTADGIACQRLHTSHAFHSPLMEPMLAEFEQLLEGITLYEPQIPYLSNLTGTWIGVHEASNPEYWLKHTRQPVRFAAGVAELLRDPDRALLEVGPGQTLATLANRQTRGTRTVSGTLRHPGDTRDDTAFLLATLGQIYCANVSPDWAAFYTAEQRHKVPLPSYPFERERYWSYPAEQLQQTAPQQATGKNPRVAEWLYLPYWKPAPLSRASAPSAAQRWLIFSDDSVLAASLIDGLRAGGLQAIVVSADTAFERIEPDAYRLDPRRRDGYERLFQDLAERDALPERIVHLWSLATPDNALASTERFVDSQYFGLFSLLFLIQALTKFKPDAALAIDVITEGACAVNGAGPLRSEHATLLGPCRVIAQEYSKIACRSIDILRPAAIPEQDQLAQRLLAELGAGGENGKLAYRGGARWTEAFEPVITAPQTAGPIFRKNGVYLLTGGLGNIGLITAEHLARTQQAKLVLLGRTGLPAREDWAAWLESHALTDRISFKIRKVRELEALGAEVLTLAADVADNEQMRQAIAAAESRFGMLNGVFHCAGIVDLDLLRSLNDADIQHSLLQFGPKIMGLLALEQVLPKTLDFCLSCSSLAAYMGGVGGAAYAAANGFMDAFVHRLNTNSTFPWLSVNWDAWQPLEESQLAMRRTQTLDPAWARFAIQPEEGIEALLRILSLQSASQVLVSTQDLPTRMERLQYFEAWKENRADRRDSAALHARPELDTEYVAPRNDIEAELADIWQNILGIAKIGVHDNFFKLGGDSLVAIQLSTRLRDTFQVDFSVHNLFDDPTIAGLAEKIEKLRQSAQTKLDEIAEKLALVESLSDEEVKKMLAELGE